MEAGASRAQLKLIPLGAVLNSQNVHMPFVNLLLKAGADVNSFVNTWDDHGHRVLHKAAQLGHLECLTALIRAGADVNTITHSGNTALHWACKAGSDKCVAALIEARADVNIANKGGCTPLEIAAKAQSSECVEILHHNGAQGTMAVVSEEDATSLLHTFIRFLWQVDPLVMAGVDVNQTDKNGKNALDICLSISYQHKENHKKRTAEILLAAGASLSSKTRRLSRLFYKIKEGDTFEDVVFHQNQTFLKLDIGFDTCEVLPLQNYVRRRLRRHLLRVNDVGNLFTWVPCLPLPSRLQTFLLLGVVLEKHCALEGYYMILNKIREREGTEGGRKEDE